MKTSTKLAMAFLAVATASGSAAFADERPRERGERENLRFERADADSSGDVTFEEFAAAMKSRIGAADTDGDGKMTVAEIASEIERMRAERRARRIVERFDTDGDGMLTAAEIESRQKKMFALMDRNDDGKIVPEEMRQGRNWRR
ncbi:EF-hand domain-containing protein [Kumtagia ephedrae]|jgi:Ca2+-binding EF-hand superfamily protein|uniref:Acid-shock protein n=1 Tax=Kumtagia ephedrae TaxID=2116701 RepID=A0A2P7RU10_9HYPH|nr:acid-shock protein [Mesorhizobium ephedrae]PSJ53710.1 acid-shock protein [Mesorhizobium ephedrae]